jgi:hypothetical protein
VAHPAQHLRLRVGPWSKKEAAARNLTPRPKSFFPAMKLKGQEHSIRNRAAESSNLSIASKIFRVGL